MQRTKEKTIQKNKVIGKILYVPKLRSYLRYIHQHGGWDSKDTTETQNMDNFQFNGEIFSQYIKEVIKREIKSLYLPAAYAGTVAKILADSGYDVTSSDISDFWVGKQRELGLKAEKRSFEDIPYGRFDAVVSFEPYCIPKTLAVITMLRMLSMDLPYIEISLESYHNIDLRTLRDRDAGKKNGNLMIPCPEYEAQLKKWMEEGLHDVHQSTNAKSPIILNDITKGRSYEYGARYEAHLCYDGIAFFNFNSFIPTPLAVELASLDLQVLEMLGKRGSAQELSLNELAKRFKKSVKKMTGTIDRFCSLFGYSSLHEKHLYEELFVEIRIVE
jgi:hypothetical protein